MADRVQFLQMFQQLNEDPRFKAMSYAEQQQVRSQWIQRNIAKVPEFTTLSPDAQGMTVQRMVTAPPSFLEETDWSRQVVDLANRAGSVTPEAQREGDDPLALASDIVADRKFFTNVGPLGKLRPLMGDIMQVRGEFENPDTRLWAEGYHPNPGTEDYKAYEYLEQTVSRSLATNTYEKVLGTVTPFLGVIGNIASGRVAFNAPLNAARQGARLLSARHARTPLQTWLYGSALAEVPEATLDGVMMLVNDLTTGQVESNIGFGMRPGESQIGNIAKNFGTNFAADLLFFTGLSVMGGLLKSTAQVFRYRGFRAKGALDAVTDDQAGDFLKRIVSGAQFDKATFNALPPQTQQHFLKLRRVYEAAKNLDEMPADVMADMLATKRGYRILGAGDNIRLEPLAGLNKPAVEGVFSTTDEAIRKLFAVEMTGPNLQARTIDALSKNEFTVQQIARVELGDKLPNLDVDTIAKALVPDAAGNVNPNTLRTASRSLAQQSGATGDVVRKLNIETVADDVYWKLASDARVRDGALLVPQHIKSVDEMSAFVKQYGDDMTSLIGTGKRRTVQHITDVIETVPKVRDQANLLYLETLAQRGSVGFEVMPNGTYRVGDMVYATLDDATSDLYARAFLQSEDGIREAFGRQFGFKFEFEPQVGWHVEGKHADVGGNIFSGNHETIQGAADELMRKGFVPSIPQSQAMNVVIDNDGTGLLLREGAVAGPWEYVRDYANKFFDPIADTDILRKYPHGSVSKGEIARTFRVTAPKWGVIAEFDSFKAANEFMQQNLKEIESLRNIGLMKGVLEIDTIGGQFVTREIGESTLRHFDTYDALQKYVTEKVADPVWAKEISNMDQAFVDSVWDSMADDVDRSLYLRKGQVPKAANFDVMMEHATNQWGLKSSTDATGFFSTRKHVVREIGQSVKDNFQTPTYQRMKRIAGNDGMDFIADSFETMEKQMKIARGTQSQLQQALHNVTNFDGAPGHKRRIALRPFLETPAEEWASLQGRLGITLGDADQRFLKRFRDTSDALGEMFGIDLYKWNTDYLPHLREWAKTGNNIQFFQSGGSAADVLGHSKFGRSLPNELKFFAEYLRADELYTFLSNADPQDVLAKYMTKGVKNMTMGTAYDTIKTQWNAVAKSGNVSPQAKTAITHYMESIMGMYTDESSQLFENSAREVGRIFSNRIKAKGETQVVKDFISQLHGLTIAATMSFRPWPIIRNMQQIWTTLAPMYGNDAVHKAMKKLNNEKYAEQVFDRLAKSGRLQDRVPIYGMLYEGNDLAGSFNRMGMKRYMNSDDWTRMIADVTVRDTFADAAAKLSAGTVDEKQFIRLANLHRLDNFDQRKIIDLMKTSYESAVDYMGDVVTRETFFAYTAGANPPAFKGLWGRLFGMFGHYPVYYMQTIMNGLKRGNVADRLLYASRVAFNTAALWFTFEAVGGIRGDDFVPWKTMFFDGGPYYKLVNDAMSAAAGSPGSSWRNVRRDAGRLFIPGSIQARSTIEALNLMEQGKSYEGFLRLMSAPLAPDR